MAIRYALAAALGLGLALPAAAAPEGWKPLISPGELAAILEHTPEVRVVQVSGDFAAARIPGAVDAPYAEWRGPPENPGALPETAKLQALVQRLGIAADTPVVVVHEGRDPTDMGTATRVYWTLKSLGVQDLAVLNGGLAAWAAAGLPTDGAAAAPAPSDFAPELAGTWRVTTDEVKAFVERGGVRLVDARPAPFHAGEAWTVARPGTIAGAESLPFERWFDGNALRDPDELRAMVAAEGMTDAGEVVSFCNTGHWASINWFVLSELAGVDTRLYAESMAEWGQAGGPVDNAPGRLEVYGMLTRDWLLGLF